jgi:two-component system, cell cycle sensor histidine kinase and response regulator CckA
VDSGSLTDSRASLNNAPIACHEIDASGKVTFVNPAECRMLGISEGRILGRPIWEFVAPEELEAGRESHRRKLSGEQPLAAFERIYVRPDGGRLMLEIHDCYMLDALGRVVGLRSFLLDITRRKRAEQAVRDSEARYRHLVEHASDIIYRTDFQGRFLFCNSRATELLGYANEELLGHKYLELIRPDFRAAAQKFYRRQLARRVPHTYFEFPVIAKDGREVWVGQTVVLAEEAGRVVGVEAVTRDITQQRRAGEEQQRAREELEACVRDRTHDLELAIEFLRREMEERQQAEQERRRLEEQIQHTQRLESLGVLAGGIAHDFNNLLASIMGYASLALLDLPDSAPARRSIQHVVDASRSAAELTQQMLAYSGRGQFVLGFIDLSRLIEEVTRLLGTLISKKAVLRMNLPPALPAIKADAAQLRQIVMNLVTNASDALGEQNGFIQITTGTTTVAPGRVPRIEPGSMLPPGEYVYLEVADTGCGMDASTKARIFDPFFSTKFTGRGLGLAAVLGIVRAHGGTIQVDSEPGYGTSFRVLFPCAGEEAALTAGDTAPPADDWRGEGLVLVVDDESSVRDLAALILERAGFTVVTAADGHEAVARFSEHAADICAVVLDLTMPGMDGAEVYQHLVKLRAGVKVIVCSGYNVQDFDARFGGERPALFLRKPFLPSELIDKLRATLVMRIP